MKGLLNHINQNEVLKYLGYKGGKVDAKTLLDVGKMAGEVMRLSQPAFCFRVFTRDEEFRLEGTNFALGGEDIKRLLADCKKCILLVATLGMGIENALRSRQVTNMYEALLLDSCASAAIENVCDNFQLAFAENDLQCGQFLTDRFSPGYGDLPFSQQKELCALLQTEKSIGVSLNASGIMIPRKTVSAIIGIADTPQEKRFRGCETCSMFENCAYRKGERHCGRTESIEATFE